MRTIITRMLFKRQIETLQHRSLLLVKRHDLLKAIVSKYCVQKLSHVNGDNLDELDPHLAEHQGYLKL